jgi:hypothetical protein
VIQPAQHREAAPEPHLLHHLYPSLLQRCTHFIVPVLSHFGRHCRPNPGFLPPSSTKSESSHITALRHASRALCQQCR